MDDKFNIIRYKTITSTNTELFKMADNGAKEWTVLIADEQTAGKGRMGRSFESPSKTGVYMSILLRPDMIANKAIYITIAAASAASKAIEDISNKNAYIKWVNDIIVDDKKVCGILAESKFLDEEHFEFVILGIGVNIFTPSEGFSDEIKDIAGCVLDEYDANAKEMFVEKFLEYFSHYYENGLESSFDEYKLRSYLIGHNIEISDDNEKYNAFVEGIDDKCGLVVRKDDGSLKTYYWGSMRLRRL